MAFSTSPSLLLSPLPLHMAFSTTPSLCTWPSPSLSLLFYNGSDSSSSSSFPQNSPEIRHRHGVRSPQSLLPHHNHRSGEGEEEAAANPPLRLRSISQTLARGGSGRRGCPGDQRVGGGADRGVPGAARGVPGGAGRVQRVRGEDGVPGGRDGVVPSVRERDRGGGTGVHGPGDRAGGEHDGGDGAAELRPASPARPADRAGDQPVRALLPTGHAWGAARRAPARDQPPHGPCPLRPRPRPARPPPRARRGHRRRRRDAPLRPPPRHRRHR